MQALGLLLVIHQPTKITDESFSLIDKIFTSKVYYFEAGIVTFGVSDKFSNFLIFTDCYDSTQLIKKISYRLNNEQTLEDIFVRLQNYIYEIILNHDCEVALEMFNELLLKEFNLCRPLQTKLLNEKDLMKPWIDGYIKGFIKKTSKILQIRETPENESSGFQKTS